MHKWLLNLVGVVLLGVVSSLIAWKFTVDWKLAGLSVIILMAAGAALVTLPVLFTNIVLRLNQSGIARIYLSQYAAERNIRVALSHTVREIDVLAIRGFGIFALKDSLLYKTLSQANEQLRVRILLLDPASPKCSQRAQEIGEQDLQFAEKLTTAIGAIKELRRVGMRNIECRLYDRLPVWRIVRVDDCMFISSFLPRHDGHMTAMYRVHRGSLLSLFPGFKRHFDELWDASADKPI